MFGSTSRILNGVVNCNGFSKIYKKLGRFKKKKIIIIIIIIIQKQTIEN